MHIKNSATNFYLKVNKFSLKFRSLELLDRKINNLAPVVMRDYILV